jgi:putative transposase
VKKCYRFRLYPTKTQAQDLQATLDECRAFYNGLLDERNVGYENGHTVTKTEQLRRVKELKHTRPDTAHIHSHVLQVVVADLDRAFQNFFRRVRSGETPGFPRYRGRDRFDSFGLKELGNGFCVDGRRLRISGIGRIAVRWHRQLPQDIKTVRITRNAGKWFACFSCECENEALPKTGDVVGIDVGISHLLATSDGAFVDNPRWYRAGEKDLRRAQRCVSRKKKGGRNRRKSILQLQRHHDYVKNSRKDFLNKVAHWLVDRYDIIALEDLRIKNMVRNRHLSKSILDAGWNGLVQRLQAKAESAGRVVVLVPAAYTSKTCSRCGVIFGNLKLSDRWVACGCGLSLDRDTNAAVNILCRSGLGHSLWASTQGNGLSVAQEAVPL